MDHPPRAKTKAHLPSLTLAKLDAAAFGQLPPLLALVPEAAGGGRNVGGPAQLSPQPDDAELGKVPHQVPGRKVGREKDLGANLRVVGG